MIEKYRLILEENRSIQIDASSQLNTLRFMLCRSSCLVRSLKMKNSALKIDRRSEKDKSVEFVLLRSYSVTVRSRR